MLKILLCVPYALHARWIVFINAAGKIVFYKYTEHECSIDKNKEECPGLFFVS